jgi:hypothetical protein
MERLLGLPVLHYAVFNLYDYLSKKNLDFNDKELTSLMDLLMTGLNNYNIPILRRPTLDDSRDNYSEWEVGIIKGSIERRAYISRFSSLIFEFSEFSTISRPDLEALLDISLPTFDEE